MFTIFHVYNERLPFLFLTGFQERLKKKLKTWVAFIFIRENTAHFYSYSLLLYLSWFLYYLLARKIFPMGVTAERILYFKSRKFSLKPASFFLFLLLSVFFPFFLRTRSDLLFQVALKMLLFGANAPKPACKILNFALGNLSCRYFASPFCRISHQIGV